MQVIGVHLVRHRFTLPFVAISEDNGRFFKLAHKNTAKNLEISKLCVCSMLYVKQDAHVRHFEDARELPDDGGWIHPAEESEVPAKKEMDYSDFQLTDVGHPSSSQCSGTSC